VRVELSDEAAAQAAEIDAWWRVNREKAPDLFTDEFERALEDLGAIPSLGTVYGQGPPAVKRLLLHRTHYYLYFIEEADRLYVVAVWSCFRGRGPKL
jgi:plasmid stabilization system protein ParE